MQQKIINMLGNNNVVDTFLNTRLSFRTFIRLLTEKSKKAPDSKKELLNFIITKLNAHPQLKEKVLLEDLVQYKDILDLVYLVLTNLADDEKCIYWGLSIPMTATVFYGTDSLYALLEDADSNEYSMQEKDKEAFFENRYDHYYSHILQHFYGIAYVAKNSLVRSFKDIKCNLTRHFELHLNTDFVEVKVNQPLPEIDKVLLRAYSLADDAVSKLQQVLPIDNFSFSGFTITTITEITKQYALDNIRDYIVQNKPENTGHTFSQIVQSLKQLLGTNEIEFNLLPFYEVNGNLLENLDSYCQSILFSATGQDGFKGPRCLSLLNKFVSNPRLLFFSDLKKNGPSGQDAVYILNKAGVKSYALFPVYYNHKPVGAIEVYSRQHQTLTEAMLGSLKPAKELVGQLMHNTLTAFENDIEEVIKEKFTSLQPSVQWKFNEVAWRFLEKKKGEFNSHEPDRISFENVYPLYGGIDIRNSTIERNKALHEDLRIQFEVLLQVLETLKEKTQFVLLEEKIYSVKQWLDLLIPDSSLFNQEAKLNDYLENEMLPFLNDFTAERPDLRMHVDDYFVAVEAQTGIAHANKRRLEMSMNKVIAAVNGLVLSFRDEIQKAYPCYFEKIRTDGVEYDIYIGQSITPGRPYSDIFLNNLRLMQLSSMAAITRHTHSMQQQLPTPVETTQLIFIHSNAIDIRFRRDEKRFDVEGAHNIRYHIIKKRIDKVHLKDSFERLTQPDKIAMVYFNQKEADEYITYIKYLQAAGVLSDDLEYLELEELQGVAGLKALRIGVVF